MPYVHLKEAESEENTQDEKVNVDFNDKYKQAAQISQMRILTDEDFRKIEAAQINKEVTSARRGKKRPAEEQNTNK